MFGRPVGEEDNVFFRAIKKAGTQVFRTRRGDARSCSAIYTSALICAMGLYNANSQGPVYRVSKQGRTSLDYPRVKDRVREFLNAATSDA